MAIVSWLFITWAVKKRGYYPRYGCWTLPGSLVRMYCQHTVHSAGGCLEFGAWGAELNNFRSSLERLIVLYSGLGLKPEGFWVTRIQSHT